MGKKTIEDCSLKGKKVLLRVDYNVPRDKVTGEITDDERIQASLRTLRYLQEQGARVAVMSHLGRPKGQVVEELRLDKVAERLSQLLGEPVAKADDCVGDEVAAQIDALKDGQVILLENVRFHPEEEKNDLAFAKRMAKMADIFVNDAFGTAHRAHCTTEGIGHYLPTVAGFLIKNEISSLARAVTRPVRPFVAIVGGAKISDKIGVIEKLLSTADTIIIGGGMANTFLAAQGYDMKASLVEAEKIDVAKQILDVAKSTGKTLLLPVDLTVSQAFDDEAGAHVVDIDSLADGDMALDIGPATVEAYVNALSDAKTVFWNGPMGVFEKPAFAKGTNALAQGVADTEAYSIVGGGDSVAAIHQAGLADRINHISTGGGASLTFLEGRILPGLAVIEEREEDGVRRPLFMANWKMNKNRADAKAFLRQWQGEIEGVDTVVCGPFTTLASLQGADGFALGAQNFYPETSGAYTGEISLEMLGDWGVRYVLVGHSERRQLFAEDDALIARKFAYAVKEGFVPVLCLGESKEEREAGAAENTCTRQLSAALAGLSVNDLPEDLVIAYEPIWAIGTGLTATAEDAENMAKTLRDHLQTLFGDAVAHKARILYGGSVKADNVAAIMSGANVDGALVGGASLDAATFYELIEKGRA